MKNLVGIGLQGQCMPYEGLLSLVSVLIILIIVHAGLLEL